MIQKEKQAEILRLFHAEGMSMREIATNVGVHRETVARVVETEHKGPPVRVKRQSIADPYIGFLLDTLEKYPRIKASRLYAMAKARGYPGRPDHFRAVVRQLRPRKPAEAYLRLETPCGQQAQVDWAHFGKYQVGNCVRPLVAFVMVLSWSRQVFLRFFLDQRMASFLAGHQAAFEYFGGVPRELLYDNLKSAVLERRGDAIRFNPNLIDFARAHRYNPRPVAPYRGNEKGKVERAIRYARDSFFPARVFEDLADLNRQALEWCSGTAAERLWKVASKRTVGEAFAEERGSLLPMPPDAHPFEESHLVSIGKTPYARFDRNDYSVPHEHVRKRLLLLASPTQVRILDGSEEIACHERCYEKGRRLEDPEHLRFLAETKRAARKERATDLLLRAAPTSETLLTAIAQAGGGLGGVVSSLMKELDRYGAAALEAACKAACAAGALNVHSVRQILETQSRARDAAPPIPVALPQDPRVRELLVRPHELACYDTVEVESK